MKFLIGLAVLILAAVIVFFASVIFGGLAIATANSWILGGNFSDAWTSVWNRKFIVFGWSVLFILPLRFRFSSSN